MYKAILAIVAVILLVGCAQQIDTTEDTVQEPTTANEDIADVEETIDEIDILLEDLDMDDLDSLDAEIENLTVE